VAEHTHKGGVSRVLLVAMVGFGACIGLVFPPFTWLALGLGADRVLRPVFFAMCIGAGIIVGLVNYAIFRFVLYNFLSQMNAKILQFKEKLRNFNRRGVAECDDEECLVAVEVRDHIVGNIATSFNEFIRTIQQLFRAQLITEAFLDSLKNNLQAGEEGRIVVEAYMAYFGADGGGLVALEQGELRVIEQHGVVAKLDKANQEFLRRIVAKGEPKVLTNLPADRVSIDIGVGSLAPGAVAFIPLAYEDQTLGVCVLVARESFARPFDSIEATNFIHQATPFLFNRKLLQRLERLAAIDELTGAFNRAFGLRRLAEELSRCDRRDGELSLCMVDLDDFKQVNDTYGHPAGDLVLKEVCELMRGATRLSDFVVRYGGEEFVVVMPDTSADAAAGVMERLRKGIHDLSLAYQDHTISVSISGGLASYPADDTPTLESLIARADSELYRAKRQGKDRVLRPESTAKLRALS
jgi:two-component system cell cycle response regulator